MNPKKRNPAAAGTAHRVECLTGKVNTATDSPRRAGLQLLAAFGLAAAVTVMVMAMSGRAA